MSAIKYLLALISCLACSLSIASTSSEYRVLESAGPHIIKLHSHLSSEASGLEDASQVFCSEQSDEHYSQLTRSWKRTMLAWQRILAINFGPIDERNSAWRFQFWPDPINLVQRKFKSRVSGRNKATDSESLSKASVAIQGLSALEYLIFDESIHIKDLYRENEQLCALLQNTAKNLAEQAGVLHSAWRDDYSIRWLKRPADGSEDLVFKRRLESLHSGIVMSLGAVKKAKLAKALGYNVDAKAHRNPWMLESWRSRSSLENINVNLKSALALYQIDFGLSAYLLSQSNRFRSIDQRIKDAFLKAIKLSEPGSQSAFDQLHTDNVERLENLYVAVSNLYLLLKNNYTKSARIQFRFNAHDGD